MDSLNDNICHGCLNSERKISIIRDITLKECFEDILKRKVPQIDNVQLCFECAAILVKIKKFQEKAVFSAQKLLEECNKKTFSQTSLQANTLYSISLYHDVIVGIKENHDNDDQSHYEIINTIKEEINHDNDNDIEMKDEIDNDSSNLDVDDALDERNKDVYMEVKLSKREIADERESLKASEEYVNAMFKCHMCVITFTNSDDLDEHVKGKHEVKAKYQCTICKCGFTSMITFKYHANRHRLRLQCNTCYRRFVYKRDVIKHYNTVHCHGIEHFTNESEERSTKVPTESIEISQSTEVFTCDVCSKQFRWKASLRKHLERHRIESGQKRKPYCEPCKLYFATTSNLKKHVRASSKHQIQLKLRKIKDSNIEDKDGAIKEIQSSVNSSRQMFCCSQCDRKFQWHGNLLRHMNSHRAKASGELVCVPCNRTFSSIATYQQHMKISKKHVTEDDFKYMCSDCGKRFADKTRLKDHVDWEHLKNYVHTCGECQKAFKTRTSLYLHKQVVHQKDRSEHLCDHCGKHFPNHSKLRVHIRAAHSAVAAYKCASCGAKFAWHSCLSRHMRRLHKNT